MEIEERIQLFDNWADRYDQSIHSSGDFPFAGYEQVLDEIFSLAVIRANMAVLDLGTGTGNLAGRFAAAGCRVWGLDFSAKMLLAARAKLPQVRFVQGDIRGDWPAELPPRFERIVSAYVWHEFDLATKINLLNRLAKQHLIEDGYLVIGDIAFASRQMRDEAQRRWERFWDEEEVYWAADETIATCADVGLQASFRQISECGGVFIIQV